MWPAGKALAVRDWCRRGRACRRPAITRCTLLPLWLLQYASDIESGDEFWTDANGREMIKRVRSAKCSRAGAGMCSRLRPNSSSQPIGGAWGWPFARL